MRTLIKTAVALSFIGATAIGTATRTITATTAADTPLGMAARLAGPFKVVSVSRTVMVRGTGTDVHLI
jgi:hypothetical protein